ncbi:hypothetical protein IP88_16675 [alpha proteobacterium AAP81b]|nr:hypothetical protein IP88_16675 [alpha proteobacterium AAP81b]
MGAPPARVEVFLPMGAVAGPEQISVRFSTPMVALGDPRLPAPITGNCSQGATGRWADAYSYAIDLPTPLPGGHVCRYTLVPGLKDASGAAITGARQFVFSTGGPTVRAVLPRYTEIEEDQLFLIALNAAPTPASVAAGAACLVEGVGEAVPLDVQPDKVRDTVLNGAAKDWRVKEFLVEAGWRKPEYGEQEPRAKAVIVAAKCRRTLPAGGAMTLVWGAGIATPTGLSAGEADRRDFKIRAAFAARLECSRVNAAAACSPLEALRLSFTGQVPTATALAVRLQGPDGKAIAPKAPEGHPATLDGVSFPGPFVERSTYRVVLPAGLADDSGRPLTNAARFPLDVPTGDFPPLAKFAGTFGILEAAEGGVLPVTLRAVDPQVGVRALPVRALDVTSDAEVAAWLRRLDKAEERDYAEQPVAGGGTRSVETTRQTPLIAPKTPARGFTLTRSKPRAFEVVGIPLAKRGFHVVELASPALGAALLGPGRTRYVATGALVTDLAVHFQWGLGASLAWVTRLSDAAPVANAVVAVSDSCTGALLWRGRTDAQGRAVVGDVLPKPESYGGCDYSNHPLMVSARAGGDFSFTLTTWGNGIQASDFNLPTGYGFDRGVVHTIFDRTLAKPGETLNMKLLLRRRVDAGIAAGEAIAEPKLVARHFGSDTTLDVALAMAGQSGVARLVLPKSAPLGDWVLELSGKGREAVGAGNFSVEAFRLPTIRASVAGPKARQVAPTAVAVDLGLTYLAGGAVARAPVKLRTQVETRTVSVPDYDGWSFDGEAIVPGVVPLDGGGEDGEGEPAQRPTRAAVTPVTLSANGAARVTVGDIGPITRPSTLIAEMDYDDANGEVSTAGARIDLDPAAVRVGIKTDGWLAKSDDLRLKLVVLDLDGRPVAGRKVKVQLFSRETYSYRKRLIGGFYAYDNSRETKRLDTQCEVRSDARGLATCALDAGVSGEVIALAETTDDQGRVARATTSVWLAGDDDWWFGGDNGDRMDVVAESPAVAADGTARLQVRMPFREATALVTVLRDGVIDSFVTQLEGKDPVVEVRMKGSYAPNVYVSVLAVRGRVAGWRLWLADLARRWNLPWLSREAAYPTALVDLAKPSYRIGMAKLRVGWEAHRLGVKVATDRPAYPVRGVARAVVSVAPPAGRKLPPDAEIAFAAVDEALLQLKGNDSWDVLTAMMTERPLAVVTATAQTQVVGKRHYGRKAVASGGGGGGGAFAGVTRSDFQPVLGWWGRVKLGADGRAALPVRLNDSLSGFRLVAVATAGSDLFGSGAVTIRTTQDLQLLSGLPPVVRDGDDYLASFVVRNTTLAAMTVRLSGNAGARGLPVISVAIPPGEARTASWRIVAPAAGAIVWRVNARADNGPADRVEIAQSVLPAVPDQVLQATFFQAGAPAFPVALPAGALPGRGGIDVALSRSLGGGLPGVKAWAAAYPYDCIEQRFSIAVALGDRARWDAAAASLPGYLDPDGLVRFFPADWIAGDDALTAYILRLSALTGWPLPDDARGRMAGALANFVAGRLERSHANVLVVDKASGAAGVADLSGDGPPRRLAALAALAAAGAATPVMAEAIPVVPDAWPTTSVIDWAFVLDALPGVTRRDERLAQAEAILKSRLDLQGTTLRITRPSAPWQTLASDDTTRATLLMLALRRPGWAAETPRLARALMLAQQRGAWDTTPANALGSLAMAGFGRAFEAAPVSGRTRIGVGATTREIAWGAGNPPVATLPWPPARAPLSVAHSGSGAPWAMVTARAAVPLAAPFASGFALSRRVTPVSQAVAGRWSRGDVMRVVLTVTPRAPVEWVVINDPVPAGATILGGSLGGRSQLLAGGEGGSEPPTFVERRQDAVHAHFAYLGRAPVIYEYTVRLGSAGTFRLPPTRVEALYSPEMLALLPNRPVVVAAK